MSPYGLVVSATPREYGDVRYSYSSPFTYVLNSSYTLTESAFNRPRYMNCVPTYLNTGNVCP